MKVFYQPRWQVLLHKRQALVKSPASHPALDGYVCVTGKPTVYRSQSPLVSQLQFQVELEEPEGGQVCNCSDPVWWLSFDQGDFPFSLETKYSKTDKSIV